MTEHTIHSLIAEQCDLAKTYAEDGAFHTAAKVLSKLAARIEDHAAACDNELNAQLAPKDVGDADDMAVRTYTTAAGAKQAKARLRRGNILSSTRRVTRGSTELTVFRPSTMTADQVASAVRKALEGHAYEAISVLGKDGRPKRNATRFDKPA